MGQPGRVKKKGRTVLEKRRIKQEKQLPRVSARKSDRVDTEPG